VATVTSNDARRPKRVRPVIIEDGEFEVAVEWSLEIDCHTRA
jgi:hypothetical protein